MVAPERSKGRRVRAILQKPKDYKGGRAPYSRNPRRARKRAKEQTAVGIRRGSWKSKGK